MPRSGSQLVEKFDRWRKIRVRTFKIKGRMAAKTTNIGDRLMPKILKIRMINLFELRKFNKLRGVVKLLILALPISFQTKSSVGSF